ncbi:hypothetical protein EIO_1300 [Ketogulonicigenium vulgare Y25]|uniref:Uncharacterized protein n=1 Tax=Ketogulonicigenium vulgare (strain WSH-001) TaxID=759362 RepID=F9Y506_KETVW|nr:hypothetical protein EIO_1300 [Ketogulonicigenium vulgare Y25]AEM40638.1 hypothetical protein KVU_0799 [Ketogulonicigenium vulgare WSH-001]ALJ80811.1 hypothetical protein KVH_06250 [Ketogulonicigenium vulgare]AOZ54352.1 hypothetical protein KVC_1335 [Ketogulonicigenium vulgare]
MSRLNALPQSNPIFAQAQFTGVTAICCTICVQVIYFITSRRPILPPGLEITVCLALHGM